ncbi:MAG: hypothetical protein HY331_18385, partial [Chloroflexi bacterium]|nr:hypothetical protein [Chloroflexota bacterium]
TTVTFTDNLSIGPGESANIFNGNTDATRGAVLPDQFLGSATAVSTNGVQIVGIVNDLAIASGVNSSASYNMEATSAATTKLVVPLVRNVFPADSRKLFTGLQVMNAGSAATRIQVQYFGQNKTLTTDTDVKANVAPGTSASFLSSNTNASTGLVLPENFLGSAIVTSLDGQPLIGILNDQSMTGQSDAAIFNALHTTQ